MRDKARSKTMKEIAQRKKRLPKNICISQKQDFKEVVFN
jgi:hypothetical protein